jgi:hypothetical protein
MLDIKLGHQVFILLTVNRSLRWLCVVSSLAASEWLMDWGH